MTCVKLRVKVEYVCNEFGQTGNGRDSEYQLTPMKMNCMISEKFQAISCDFLNSMALTEDGRAFSWGQNTYE
jgi:alpha-tubulin suppressor-like RCC1 family protein